jgi:tetratricopeptide (TPR) repeat protein
MAYGLWLARKDSPPARFVEMDAYIKRFAGQPVAARLLAAKAADLAYNSSVYWRSESDPTERVLALLDVVKQIESGPYAGSPWIEQAVITVAQSDLSQSLRVSEENRFRLRAAYMDFLRDHVGLARTPAWLNFRLASFVRRHVAPLENPDDPDATVETVLTGMTRFGLSADEASLATAQYYLRPHGVSPERWPALVEKGTAIVSRLAAQGGDRYAARKALAILASKAFYDGRLDDARTLYDRYVRRYPSSAWAWVAALRSAQTFEAEGDRRAAIAAFRRVSNRYRDQPLARVLGRYFAGSQFEVLGDFDSARAEYRVAMGGWDDAYGNMYDAPASEGFRNVPAGEVYLSPSRRITKAALAARIDALAVLSRPGGDLLVRARWQQEHRQFSQASATFAEYLKIHPRSPEASEVLRERHAALLRAAVWLAAIEAPGRDLPRARAMLDELSAEPFGFYVVAADIAKATLLRSEGATSESEALVSAALERLIEAQRPLRERAPVDALEADARAIRAVLFQPRRPRPFALVNPTMTFVDSSGTRTTRQVLQSLPAAGRAVFVTAEEQSALGEIIAALGGSRTRQRTSVMDTFNIPAGASVDVAAFWGQFFAIEPWTWGGWVIGGDPSIGTVTFLDEARTRAVVEISQGSGGSTIVMEKSEGEWRSVGVRNSWVT